MLLPKPSRMYGGLVMIVCTDTVLGGPELGFP